MILPIDPGTVGRPDVLGAGGGGPRPAPPDMTGVVGATPVPPPVVVPATPVLPAASAGEAPASINAATPGIIRWFTRKSSLSSACGVSCRAGAKETRLPWVHHE